MGGGGGEGIVETLGTRLSERKIKTLRLDLVILPAYLFLHHRVEGHQNEMSQYTP